MTEEVVVDNGVQTAAVEASAPEASGAPVVEGVQPEPAPFKIPDEYQSKGWVSKIKSEQDLWKQLSETQSLIGKKTIDLASLPPEQLSERIGEVLQKVRPESADDYELPEGVEAEMQKPLKDLLHKHNVPAKVAKEFLSDYQEFTMKSYQSQFDEEGFHKSMAEALGGDYKSKIESVGKVIKPIFSEDTRQLLESLPNQQLAHVMKDLNLFIEKFGASESGSQVAGDAGNVGPKDVDGERRDIIKQIQDMEKRPYQAEDKQRLLQRLISLNA